MCCGRNGVDSLDSTYSFAQNGIVHKGMLKSAISYGLRTKTPFGDSSSLDGSRLCTQTRKDLLGTQMSKHAPASLVVGQLKRNPQQLESVILRRDPVEDQRLLDLPYCSWKHLLRQTLLFSLAGWFVSILPSQPLTPKSHEARRRIHIHNNQN